MQSPQRILDDEDESVRIAVTALGDMRNSRSPVYTCAPVLSFLYHPHLPYFLSSLSAFNCSIFHRFRI
jgi:hypothetical protein